MIKIGKPSETDSIKPQISSKTSRGEKDSTKRRHQRHHQRQPGDCLVCCRKCKGLFPMEDDIMKHIPTCCGSPYKSPCLLFACERKVFLQLIRLEGFRGKDESVDYGSLHEDMQLQSDLESQPQYIQGATEIGCQAEASEQSLFLTGNQQVVAQSGNEEHTQYLQGNGNIGTQCKTADPGQFISETSNTGPQTVGADHAQFLSNKNEEMTSSDMNDRSIISPGVFFPTKLEESMTGMSGMSSQPSLIQEPMVQEHETSLIKQSYLSEGNEEKVKSAIARNLKYLQDTNLTRIPSPIEKQLGLFCDSRLSFPRLQSPLERQFQTRMQSPVDKAINFLGEPGVQGMQSTSQTFSSNPSIPFSCNLGTDLLGSYSTQDDNPTALSSIEEFPTLQYLDLAKKDPFWGQNIGLSQINTKDPFLINASEPSGKLASQKMSAVEKSTEDINIHSSPTLQLQDGNYFNFASTLDEPTQLDYLDLATLDFLTNPNLGSYSGLGPWRPDRVPTDKEDNIYPGDLMSTETNPFSSEYIASYPLSHSHSSEDLYTHSQHNRPGDIGKSKSLFKPISNKPGSRTKAISKRSKAQGLRKKVSKGIERTKLAAEADNSGEPSSKVQKVDDKDKVKSSPKSRVQTELNVKEHLEGFTEEEKNTFKAVLGQNRSIVVKKIKLQHPAHKQPEILEENADFTVEKVVDRIVYNCKRCTYTTAKKDNMEKHREEHAQKMTMKCPECLYTCSHIRYLKAHFASQHSKQKQVTCEICGETFKDRGKLQNHMTKHTGEHKFECNLCDYKTNLKISFTDHMKKHAGVYLSCDKEGCEFKTFYHRVLVQHKKKHDGLKQFSCGQCTYSTADAGSLKRHIQLQHLKERNFKCSKCNYYSINKYDVIIHLRNKHFQLKTYQCNQCDFKTGYANGLKYHLMAHAGIKPYKCSACDYHVNKVEMVKRHIKNIHKDKPGITVEKIDLPLQLDSKQFKCQDADKDDSELENFVIELTGEDKKQTRDCNKTKKSNDKGKNNKRSDTNEKKDGKTVLLENIIDITGTTNQNRKTSLIVSKGDGPDQGKVVSLRSKQSVDIPSSNLIRTISIPGPSGSTDDEITTFQCSVCLFMFTSVTEIMEHIRNCKNNLGSDKIVSG